MVELVSGGFLLTHLVFLNPDLNPDLVVEVVGGGSVINGAYPV